MMQNFFCMSRRKKIWTDLWRTILFFALAIFATGCATRPGDNLQSFEITQPQMGLPFRIVFYAADENSARLAARAAFGRIKQLNDILSDYDSDSELSRLSQTSGQHQAVRVSEDLWNVLERAQQFAQKTDGAFDITVGPVVNLWRKARREKKFPDPQKLAEARARVGYKNLRLDPKNHSAELEAPDMRLDLGAIAKGYAVDEALKVLRTNGVTRALGAGAGGLGARGP